MLTNGKKLLSTKSVAVDNLACLNGMRVLSTTWIVLYHTYYQAIVNPMYNPLTFLKVEQEDVISDLNCIYLLFRMRLNGNCMVF